MVKEGRSNNKVQKLFISILVIMQMLLLMTPIVQVLAEEGTGEGTEEVKELKGTEREGNVYAKNNERAVGAFKKASEYDPLMHYIVTYGVMSSSLGDGDSDYSKITNGDIEGAFRGNGEEVKNPEDKTTDVDYILRGEESEKSEEIEAGDTSENDTGDTSENDTGESLTDEEVANLRREVAEEMADAILEEIYGQRTSVNLSKEDLGFVENKLLTPQFNKEGDRVFGDVLGDWGGSSYSFVGVAEVNPKSVQNGLSSSDKRMIDDKYREKLVNVLESKKISGASSLKKEDFAGFSSGILGHISNAEKNYVSEQAGKNGSDAWLELKDTGLYEVPGVESKGLWKKKSGKPKMSTYVSKNNESDSLDYKFMIFTEGLNNKEKSGYKDGELNDPNKGGYVGFTRNTSLRVLNNSYIWTLENLAIEDENGDLLNSKIGNSIVKAYNKYLESGSQALKAYIDYTKNADKELENNAENVMVLGWTPLHIKAKWENYQDSIKEQLQKSDPDASLSSDGILIEGDPRPLMAKDIFIDTAKHSPVLIGARNRSYPVPYKSGVSLTVGNVEGNLKIEEDVLSDSIWHRPDAKGRVKTIKESINVDGTTIEGKTEGMTNAQETLLAYTSLVDSGGNGLGGKFVGKDRTIGVDNYGNIISGDTGDVAIPYWQNQFFADTKLRNHYFPHSPIVASEGGSVDTENEILKTSYNVEGLATSAELTDYITELGASEDGELHKHAEKVRLMMDEESVTLAGAQNFLEGKDIDLKEKDAKRALSVVIAASTQDAVKELNKLMLEDAEGGSEYYVDFSGMMYEGKGQTSEQEMLRWTAASLIQKAGWVRDYGMGDTIRLTIISTMTRIYNETIADSGMEFIFYTDNITNSEDWENMSVLIASLIGLTITVYLMYTGFKAYRGEVRWGKVMTKVLILSAILLYPMIAYGNMVEYMINKPSTYILGNQMRLSVVLDTYFTRSGTKRNVNEYYENMFGKYQDSDAMQLGNYNLKFYTTTDKAGFDINTTDPEDPGLNIMQRARLREYQSGNTEYPVSSLIHVEVPLMDMYRWVWDVRYGGEGVESEEYKDRYPTYEEIVEAGQVLPLFEWLSEGGGEHFGVEGYSKEVAEYEEYKIVPDVVKPSENVNPDITEGLTTYGAGYQEFKEISGLDEDLRKVSKEDIEGVLGSDVHILTASELMYNIIMNSSTEEVGASLGKLEGLSNLKDSPDERDANYYVPTDGDIRALVRDLSNTQAGRHMWYGESKGWSNFTQAVLEGDQGTDGIFMDNDGEHRDLGNAVRIVPPEEDFLGLTDIVNKYTPSQGEYSPYDRETLEEQVSRINSNLLNNYLSTYAITKRSLGDGVEDKDMLDHAEKMVMATEAYFQFNKSLGFRHFPTEYAVDSIKFDKYLSLLFIPFNEYGQETMQFFDGEKVVPMTTAEYVAMSSNVFVNLLFYVAVIMLVMFGLAYIGILYFGLLVFSMINFIKYYIIQDDYSNKSALGSIMIMTILSLSKNAIMLIIWAGSWIMNRSIAMSESSIPAYPITLIHSLAIIVALLVIFKVVLLPTWRGVMNDKENMGGVFFSDKAREVKAKLTPTGLLPGGGTGVRGGSAASKFGNSSSRPDDGVRSNAGKLGTKDEKGLSNMRKAARKITGSTAMFGGGMAFGLRNRENKASLRKGRGLSKMVGSVNDKLSGGMDSFRGIDGVERKKVESNKLRASGWVSRKHLNSLGKSMNNITHTVGGLAETAVKGAEVGSELVGFKNGVVTKMGLGSATAAAVVAKGLMSKGIKAKQVGDNVYFESSGYDLEDQGARGEIFNNSVADLQELTEGKKADVIDSGVMASEASNYNYVVGNEAIDLPFDNTSGIHEETFADLIGTREFNSLFIKPRTEDLIYGRDGHITGVRKGALKLVDPGASASEVQAKMDNLYEVEQDLRRDKGLELREDKERRGISVQGVSEEYFRNEIAPLVEDVKGLNVQGSRIVYNRGNMRHSNVINDIEDKIESYNEGVDQEFGDSAANLMQYVVKDGENQGVVTETRKDDSFAKLLHGRKDYEKNVKRFKVDKDKLHDLENNVKVTQKVKDMAKGEHGESVRDFVNVKNDMRTLINKEARNMDGRNNETFTQELVDYVKDTGIINKGAYRTVKSNVEDLKRDLKVGNITEENYHDLMKEQNLNMLNLMDSTGNLDGFILNRYDENNPYVKEFEKVAKNKAEREGKNYVNLQERYDKSVGNIDAEIERRKLMEMPLGVLQGAVSARDEEYNIDENGILTQSVSSKSKTNSLAGEDREAIRSYLMGKEVEVDRVKTVELDRG